MGTVKLELSHRVVTKCLAHAIKYSGCQVYGLLLADRSPSANLRFNHVQCLDIFPISHTRLLLPILHIADVLFDTSSDYSNELLFEDDKSPLYFHPYPELEHLNSSDPPISGPKANYFYWDNNTRISANQKSIFRHYSNKFSVESQLESRMFDDTRVVAIYSTGQSVMTFENGNEGIARFKDFTHFSSLPLITIDLATDSLGCMFKAQPGSGIEIVLSDIDKITTNVLEMLETRGYRKMRDLDCHLEVYGPEELI